MPRSLRPQLTDGRRQEQSGLSNDLAGEKGEEPSNDLGAAVPAKSTEERPSHDGLGNPDFRVPDLPLQKDSSAGNPVQETCPIDSLR